MFRTLARLTLYLLVALLAALLILRAAAHLRENQTAEALAPAQGQFITLPGTRFYTIAAGSPTAQPVLFAHGTAAWSGFWEKQVKDVANAGPYYTVAFDMPPFGFSQRPENRDYSRPAQAARILELAQSFDAPPIMVAHSFGAAAATEAVLMQPRAFAGLIIVDGALGLDPSPAPAALPLPLRPAALRQLALAASATNPLATRALLAQMLYQKNAATPELAAQLKRPMHRQGSTAAYGDWLPALLAPNADALSRNPARYANLPLPVRLIWGDRDHITPPAQAEALAAAIGQSPVHYIQQVGHIPHIEAPEAFHALLIQLLAEITAP
ncbi:MAG: alpha/beta fold hydrolase [Sulfitobacter sp.]